MFAHTTKATLGHQARRGNRDGFTLSATDRDPASGWRFPCKLRQGAFIHTLDAGDVADRVELRHIEGIVGPHQDPVRPKHLEQVGELMIGEHDRIEIDLTKVRRRRQRQITVKSRRAPHA